MDYAKHLDAIWAAFCGTLPPELRPDADALATTVGLVPVAGIPWSIVFKHEVTLAAPALFAATMPRVSPAMVMQATTAHMLAIIDAFAVDRALDHQVAAGPRLALLLEHVRDARDRAITALSGDAVSPYREAEQEAVRAIATERCLLESGAGSSLADYSSLSLAKQAVAFPAALALARAVGCDARHQGAIHHILRGIVLGLQFEDDVVDWEYDWREGGGAWAISLCRGHGDNGCAATEAADLSSLRRSVHASGVLAAMMKLARLRYREAHRLARALGLASLARWTADQEARAADLADRETRSAGYTVRAHQLSSWVMEVLG